MIALYIRTKTKTKCSNRLNINIIKQRTLLRRYARESNKDFKYYIDEGYSGYDSNRPALKNMISELKLNMIDEVVAITQDKIWRDNTIIDILKRYNVKTTFIGERL